MIFFWFSIDPTIYKWTPGKIIIITKDDTTTYEYREDINKSSIFFKIGSTHGKKTENVSVSHKSRGNRRGS
jgi:hypothetical protein